MENTVKNTERSRIGSVSEVGAINDGNLLGSRKDLNKTYLKVPQKSSAEKKEKKKNKGGGQRKWFPNAEGKYQCPFCDKSYKTPASASNHVWNYHQKEKLKAKYEKAKSDPPTISAPSSSFLPITVLEWLEVIPREIIEKISPKNLKELIIEKRKEEENKQNVAKS